jgi:glutamate-1-semialdehyde 2,1-aminomutase
MRDSSATAQKRKLSFEKSKRLQEKAHNLIPGGCHTYAKGDDQFPEQAPGFIVRGKGCHVWDPDGNEFIEYGMGLRAVTLGHAFDPVVEAAIEAMKLGNNFSRPSLVESELAELLVDLIPCAEQVKFAKDGSTVITAATKLARAYTGRSIVAFCADHPFFSINDWFIGNTEMAGGIPPAATQLTTTFRYNDIASVEALFDRLPGQIACVILEAERTTPPKDGFLLKVQQLCRKNGALFVLDEMITGFRWHIKGAQYIYDLDPDLAGFGKALGNGFAISALAGKRDIMELGGLRTEKEKVFLLSTTHGAENHALAAAIATIQAYKELDVVDVLYRQGARLAAGIGKIVEDMGLKDYVGVEGRPCNLVYFTRNQEKRPSQAFRTLFMQELIKRGVLGPSFVDSYSHSDEDIDHTIEAVGEALVVYKQGLEQGVGKFLEGRPVKPAIRRYNLEVFE